MKEKFRVFIIDKQIRRIYIFCFLICIIQFAVFILFLKELPDKVPLFYSLSWGEKQLASNYYLFIFPAAGLFFIFLNFLLSIIFFDKEIKDYFLAKLMAYYLFLSLFISSYSIYKILDLFL